MTEKEKKEVREMTDSEFIKEYMPQYSYAPSYEEVVLGIKPKKKKKCIKRKRNDKTMH